MASGGAAADDVRTEQFQGDPFSVWLTDVEEQACQDRRDAIDGASTQGDASQGENFVKTFCKMTKEKREWRDSKDDKVKLLKCHNQVSCLLN